VTTNRLQSTTNWRRAAGALVGLLSIGGAFIGVAMLALGTWLVADPLDPSPQLGIGLFCFGAVATTCAIGLMWARTWAWWGSIACSLFVALYWILVAFAWGIPGGLTSVVSLIALAVVMARSEMRRALAELREEARRRNKPVLCIC
jgi:hypothetical protein